MKKKNVYAAPNVKGVHVLHSLKHQNDSRLEEEKKKQYLEERNREENRLKELEAAKEAAYKKGMLDAQQNFRVETEKLKNEYSSLVTMFQEAARQLTDKREKIWRETEHEIIKLILAVSHKMVGYEISNNGINVVRQIVKETLSYVGERKIVAVRLSPDDVKKINTSEEMKITDQNIKILEDGTISSGGCVVETDFGNVDSQIEVRWEEIQKALVGNKNESTVH